jgi:hypothetical protein
MKTGTEGSTQTFFSPREKVKIFEAHRTGRREAYIYLKEFVLEKLEVPDWPLQPHSEAPANNTASSASRLLGSASHDLTTHRIARSDGVGRRPSRNGASNEYCHFSP